MTVPPPGIQELTLASRQRPNPHTVWHNFLGLFRAIDEGDAGLNIPVYNGGLFALDPVLESLQVPGAASRGGWQGKIMTGNKRVGIALQSAA